MVHDAYRALIKRSHPSANVGIDKVEVYGGAKIVFFTVETAVYKHHRVAVFTGTGDKLSKENDIIVSQE